jgi:pimeloyl-ACP methyl ester carboxylesterase
VRRVVALAPVADHGRAAADNLDEGAAHTLLNADPRSVGVHADGADVAARLRAGEEVVGCELVVLHGDQDAHVPLAHSVDLAGDVPAVHLTVLPGVEHFGLIDPLSDAWPEVLAALPQVEHGIRLRE